MLFDFFESAKELSVAWCKAVSFHDFYNHYSVQFSHLILDRICVSGFNVSPARCFKLVRFSCLCLAVCFFVFAFGVVNALH